MQRIESWQSFGGQQEIWQHTSTVLDVDMKVAVYLPPQAANKSCPVLYWLSGLTCTERNFIEKSGMQRYAAEQGVIVVAPDTSPRGEGVADAPEYDLGQGAGFYVNATQMPWATHYQMYEYVVKELPKLIDKHFPTNGKQSIFGHSMGGHGALMIALKNPNTYASVSAFSPIVAPMSVPWGQKAFSAYLGSDERAWRTYDSTQLVLDGHRLSHVLIAQGLADQFFEEQLATQTFADACIKMGIDADIRYYQEYDHSYYFIASFIGEHIAYHSRYLQE